MTVRTRFAPSPSGGLHVGNVRTAVLNWLFARHHGGAFVVRIEDTDPGRTIAGAEAAILADLAWLGLDWDEGPDRGGPHAPYRQSERGPLYRAQARLLRESGAAYPCFCPPDLLERQRREALARGRSPGYPGTCRTLDPGEARRREEAGARPALRLRVEVGGEVVVEDAVRGAVRFPATELEDFVLLRSDGTPTYNFAVVVDDRAMAISHVIRGAGHLSNAPRQILVYRALGAEPPVFAHIPTILGPDRTKLSKRHGARPVADYRAEGYHPDSLVNYLSLLSWSSPGGEEVLSRDRLVREVSLERIRKGDAVFDPEKLRWLSARHIERMPLPELIRALEPHLPAGAADIPARALPVAVEAIRSHLSAFSEIGRHLAAFELSSDPAAVRQRAEAIGREGRPVLLAVGTRLRALEDWSPAGTNAAVRQAGRDIGARGRELFGPLRVALTGSPHGPPLDALLTVAGRERTLRVLDAVASALDGSESP